MKRPIPFHSNAVWPPPLLVTAFVFAYGLVVVCLWVIDRAASISSDVLSDSWEIVRIRAVILACAAGFYALYRLWRFHPACHPGYATWLKLSPWTAARPLPMGPVHPVWQDACVLGVLTAIAYWHAHVNPWLPATAFGLTYLASFSFLLLQTRRWWTCLALGFLWPALTLPGVEGWFKWAIFAAIFAVIWHGYRQSLRAFPWEFLRNTSSPGSSVLQTDISIPGLGESVVPGTNQRGSLADNLSGPTTARTKFNLGWPFSALSPKVNPASISMTTNLATGALFGWWSFCWIEGFKCDPVPELIVVFAMIAAALRLAVYCSNAVPPFNVLGRIRSGRMVVPGFDKVFVTPLATVLVAVLGAIVVKRSGSWYPAAEAGSFALVWCAWCLAADRDCETGC